MRTGTWIWTATARPDDPWHFGTTSQYPALKVNFDGQGSATWQEFGYQLRESPTLTPDTSTVGQVALNWTVVATSHWSPAPTVTYTVTRGDSPLAEGLSGTTYTDTDVTSGSEYHYQVIALVDGGEATRSARLAVTATANQKPAFDDGSSTTRSVGREHGLGRRYRGPRGRHRHRRHQSDLQSGRDGRGLLRPRLDHRPVADQDGPELRGQASLHGHRVGPG